MKVKIIDYQQSSNPFIGGVTVTFEWRGSPEEVVVLPGQSLVNRIGERIEDMRKLDRELSDTVPLLLELSNLKDKELDIGVV